MSKLEMFVITHHEADARIPKDRTIIQVEKGNNLVSNCTYGLTGLYEIWKSCKSEYVGIEQEDCLFSDSLNVFKYKMIGVEQVELLLDNYDLLLPQKYYYSNYACLFYEFKKKYASKNIEELEKIIESDYDSYFDAWSEVMHRRKYAYPDMFVCKKEFLDQYCEWLFEVLGKLEASIGEKKDFDGLSLFLFNVWVEQHNDLKIKELKTADIKEPLIKNNFKRFYRFFYWNLCK